MSEFSFDQEVARFLATCRTAGLAVCDAAVGTHAANVQYVSDEAMHLLWVSNPESRHSLAIGDDPRVAVTIYAHDDRPERIHGLQMRGRAAMIDPGRWQEVYDLYTGKFPFIRASPALERAVRNQRFYEFTPTWVRWIDNRRGFGWKLEKQLT